MNLDLANPGNLLFALGPDLVLMVGSMVVMLMAAWRPDSAEHQRSVGWASLVVLLLTMAAVVYYAFRDDVASNGAIAVDDFRWASDLIFLGAAALTILLAIDYNVREGIHAGETHVLLLFATSGMMLLAAARDLIIVFLAVELMSVATYVLAGLNRRSPRAAEGALKYFLLGAFSSAFLLYGIALVYGATGSTNLPAIGDRIAQYGLMTNGILLSGIAMLIVGFGFKIAAVPFHMWAPDVYEGAPTPITGWMAAAVKAAAFSAFLRVWIEALPSANHQWHLAIWWLAALTMIGGNLIALAQRNVKRLLAYSSVAHAGYVLVAIVVSNPMGGEPLSSGAFLFYLTAYTLATMGAFAVVIALGNAGEASTSIDDYAGLWTERPGIAVAMAVFMLALLGFPIFGGMGFFAKWYILRAALDVDSPQMILAVIMMLTSVVSAGYYLYVVMVMFMRPRPERATPLVRVGGLTRFVIASTAIAIIVFGVWPTPIANWSRESTLPLRGVASFAPATPPAPVR